jgi:LPXTG-motif cell wall-anchored protein
MTADDVFKLGKTYACEIKVQINDSSFIVGSDVSGKVNSAASYSMNTSDTDGTAVPICQDEGATAVLYAVYELPAVTNVNVSVSLPCKNINIVPTEPYSVTFTKAGSASTSGDNYFAWYELTEEQYKAGIRTTGTPMNLDDRKGDKFKSGYYYSLVINFVANGDSVISDDITATVTGTTDTAFTIQADKKSAVLTAVYAPSAVYKVDVSVTDPKIGATADYKPTAKITTKGTASFAGAYWYKVAENKDYNDRSNWVEIEKNEKFEKGYYYIFSALYTANNGYVMNKAATATVNNGKENSDLTKLQMQGITGFDTEKLLVVTALFDPLKDEPVTPVDKSDSASPKTGDSDSDLLGLWALLAIASLGAFGTVGYRRKQER